MDFLGMLYRICEGNVSRIAVEQPEMRNSTISGFSCHHGINLGYSPVDETCNSGLKLPFGSGKCQKYFYDR